MKRKGIFLLVLLAGGLIKSAAAQSPHYSSELGLVGGRGIWPFVLYLGDLIFLGASFYTKQTEFYVWTITREKSPVFYWCVMSLLAALAVWFSWSLCRG